MKLPNKACIMEKNGEDAGKCNFFIDCVKYPGKGRLKGAMGFAAGVGAFLLFFLSDYNDWRWSRRSLRVCFPLGMLLLTAGTAWEIWQGAPPLHGWLRGAAVLLAVFFFGLLVYTLFFALPVEAPVPPECMRCAAIPGCCGLRDCMDVCGPQADCRFGRRRC